MIRPLLVGAWLAGMLAGPALAATHTTTVNLLSVLATPIASAKRGRARVLLPATIDTYSSPHLYGSGGATSEGVRHPARLRAATATTPTPATSRSSPPRAGRPIAGARCRSRTAIRGATPRASAARRATRRRSSGSEYGVNYTIGYIGTKAPAGRARRRGDRGRPALSARCASRASTTSPRSPATRRATSTSTPACSGCGSSRRPSTRTTRPSTTSSTPTRTATPAPT